jgi:two-component system, NtrC family, sensor histidine kinase HydH
MTMMETEGVTGDQARDDLGQALWRWVALLAALVLVSVLHYVTDARHAWLHNIYQRLYYAPIVMGAYWFGVRGGMITAVAAAMAYAPHIQHTWGHNAPYAASQYAELVIFPCAGLLVGVLADRQRRLIAESRRSAVSLEQANRDLRESHEQLRRADRLKALGEIAAGLAHEIRNPLAGMKGALEIVGSRVTPGTPEAEFAGVAATEVERLDNLVGEFLAYARPRDPEFRRVAVRDVVDPVIALLTPQAERVAVSLVPVLPAEDVQCRMDAEQMRQVVFNVTINAIQASPAGGAVEVAVNREAGAVTIAVSDQGPGIPPDAAARLFEPFFTTRTNGTGLGLAVSQRIVAAHDGLLSVGSREGGGTRVMIVLPDQPAA